MATGGQIKVKMCGMTTPEQAQWACEAGAAYVGLVFFPPSPRFVTPDDAREIVRAVPPGFTKVALLVDADDSLIETVADLPIDMLQLQGKESPERATEIRAKTGLPIMKAVGIRVANDLAQIEDYVGAVDQILVDAKAPEGAALPGGNGLAFDWTLVAGKRWPLPWLLAGGLNADNVREAISRTGATQVDLSSGIESAPGVKDRKKIFEFMDALRAI